jgi:hypothetical protein
MTGIAFWLSFTNGGGAGAWIFALQAVGCSIVLVYAFFRGERNITLIDRFTFTGTLITFLLYLITNDPILSSTLAATVDSSAFIPTFRKSFLKPWEEPVLAYAISGTSYAFAILAVDVYSFTTVFYGSCLVASNIAFVIFTLLRRRTLQKAQGKT